MRDAGNTAIKRILLFLMEILRCIVFAKLVLWDKRRLNLTFKNCWVLAGVNTIMPTISRNGVIDVSDLAKNLCEYMKDERCTHEDFLHSSNNPLLKLCGTSECPLVK